MAQPSVRENYRYRTVYEVFYLLTPIIVTPYIARVLGADLVGIASFTRSAVTYFTMVGALGTARYGAIEIAKVRDDRQRISELFWEIELLSVFTCMLALLAWLLFAVNGGGYKLYYFCQTPFILSTMMSISWFFNGQEMMKRIVLRDSAVRIVVVVCLFMFVRTREDLVKYILIYSLGQMVGNLSMWLYLPKMLTKVDFRTLRFKEHLKSTMVFFIPTIATSIYTVLDKTLIGVLTGDPFQNGYYEQAFKLIRLVRVFVFSSVNSVMGARMSYLFANGRLDEMKSRINRSMNYILFLGYACMFGLISIADTFVPVFFGKGYDGVTPLMRLMAPLVVIIGVSSCMDHQYYAPSGQKKRIISFIFAGAAVNLAFNFALIPRFGAEGAVMGSLVAEVVISVLFVMNSKEYMDISRLWKYSWKRIIAGGLMARAVIILGRALETNALTVILQVCLGAAVYFLASFIMRDEMLFYIWKQGMNVLRKIIEKNSGKDRGTA